MCYTSSLSVSNVREYGRGNTTATLKFRSPNYPANHPQHSMFINFYDKLINRFDTGAGLYTFFMLYRQKLPITVGRGGIWTLCNLSLTKKNKTRLIGKNIDCVLSSRIASLRLEGL